MFRIKIDGTYYEVKPDKNLLETCLALGFDIPYFCYHPAMGSAGACRLCAVKKFANDNDTKGRIVMSCMEPVTDGMIISVTDHEVKAFRTSIIESLMTNHPHDCPVCDEGGECHLQDMTVMTGHNYRRFKFKKRTYENQDLGPFINHEMNRCIQCYRCVRFYEDYAGGKDLYAFGSANHVYFGRKEDGILENEFSGNLVEVCPTGVFTDKTLKKHYTRKWDLTNAPSICVHCSLGCNTIVSERYGSLRRIMNRYNGSVNGYFLCDRGRFGYEFVNDKNRIKNVLVRNSKNEDLEAIDKEKINSILSDVLLSKRIIGIGSPRASLEANYALLSLTGQDNFYHGISKDEYNLVKTAVHILKNAPVHSSSLKEIEKADAIFILGEDVTNTAPVLALALRQASRNKSIEKAVKLGIPEWNNIAVRDLGQDLKTPFFISVPFTTKLDELAENTYYAAPQDIARLGFTVASMIMNNAPAVNDLDKTLIELSQKIASALKEAKNPLIVSGIQCGSEEILHATANIALALSSAGKQVSLSLIFPECNSLGLGMMEGKPLDNALELIENNQVDTVIILENNLYRRADKEQVDNIFTKCKQVIVLDQLMNETAINADLVLPVGTFAESEGTLVNNEGRAQRYYSAFPVKEPVKESWRWIRDLIKLTGIKEVESWQLFDDVVAEMTEKIPAFTAIKEYLPHADMIMYSEKIPRQALRYSGRTAMNSNISVSETKPPQDTESPLAFSMEGYKGQSPSSIIPFYWSAGWNSVQSVNKYLEEPNGSLKGGDAGIRLIEPKNDLTFSFYKNIPLPFEPKKGELLIIPVYHIFGSEELSSIGAAISNRIPEPYILINEKDAVNFDLRENELYLFEINNVKLNIKVKTDKNIPVGMAGLTYNFPGIPYIKLPGWGKFKSVTN